MGIKILIADDHRIMREGLRALLDKLPGMEVIAEAENGRATVQLAQKLKPDVVIIDITMPDLNGIEATRQIVAASSPIKVIALSMHSDRKLVTEMINAGASGYLLKDSAFVELGKAINTVVGNQIYLSPKITSIIVEDYVQHRTKSASAIFPTLTAREREVLQLLAEGKSTREIANCLYISVKTVETHRMQIANKLHIYSIAELTKYAVREGLTSLET